MNINFFRSLKNQMGFTLPEIMVGTAIIAGVALAGATLFKNQSKAQSKLNHSKNLNQFHNKLSKLLMNNYNCSLTLRADVTAASIPIGALPSVRLCDTGSYAASCDTKELLPSQLVPLKREYMVPDQYIDDTNVWQFKSISVMPRDPLAPAPITSSGPVTLRVVYAKNSRLSSNEIVTKDIVVNARFGKKFAADPMMFQECFNDQESAINNLQNDLCRSLTKVASDGTIATWNDATQSCELNVTPPGGAAIKNCTALGLAVDGIDIDGVMHCKNIDINLNSGSAIQTSPVSNCVNGTKLSAVWVAGPPGGPPMVSKLQVVCQ